MISVALAWVVAISGTSIAKAGVLVSDDFEDGILDPDLYEPLGGAVLDEVGGKLRVMTFSCEDGIRINAPSGAMSFRINQQINRPEFDVGEALAFRTMFFDQSSLQEFAFLESVMGRPFWNFCQYRITQRDGTFQDIGIWCGRGLTTKEDCPMAKDIRFDWLPPAMPGGPDRIVYQVRRGGIWQFGRARNSNLQHQDMDLRAWTVVFTGINPQYCND